MIERDYDYESFLLARLYANIALVKAKLPNKNEVAIELIEQLYNRYLGEHYCEQG